MERPVIVYTDGAASGNPGPGGFGVVMIWGSHRKEISKGFRRTTNNRMELMAAIEALKTLKRPGLAVELYSDSEYVVNAIKKGWVFNWEKQGWKKRKNPDLWQEFLKYYRMHKVNLHWVRGHAGNTENERCDVLAVAASARPQFVDEVYEKSGDEA